MATRAENIAAYEQRRARVASFGRADLVVPDRYGLGPVGDAETRFDTASYDWTDAFEATEASIAEARQAEFDAIIAAGNEPEVDLDDALIASEGWILEQEKRAGKA
jgi:hypothetical protein